jgi:hypothetical protein
MTTAGRMGKWPSVVSPLLFLTVVVVYVANGRTIGSGDTLPARYLPYSLLLEHHADLDEFPVLNDELARRNFPVLDGIPYFLHYRRGHYLSAYSPGPALLALPIYAGPVLAGAPAASWAARLEKLSAAAITALSVVCVFWALTGLVARRWALGIAAIYAFGTSSWSVSSQALWQHGPSQLFLALLLVCLVRGMRDERWLICAGFMASAAAVMRSTDALIGIPVVAWVLYARRHLTLRLVLAALAPVTALLLYNVGYFGSPLGPAGSTTAPTWAFFTLSPSLDGLSGVLLSPGRGLFIYSPVLIFSVVGLLWGVRREPTMCKPLALGVVLVLVVVGQWFRWWGGYGWGPRLLADVTPLLCFFLYPLTDALDRHRVVKAVFVLLAGLSIAAHGLGAFLYDGRWDAAADVDRNHASLWSWRDGPLVFYGREAAAGVGRVFFAERGRRPTSADSPTLLAASYVIEPMASQTFVGETLAVSLTATNTGAAVWLAAAPGGDRGTVRLGWRWSRDGVDLEQGRAPLRFEVFPGGTAHFAERISVPAVPGDYTLTIGLVSELVTWFAGQGQSPVTVTVAVRPVDLERFLSTPVGTRERSPTATIATDRGSYGRGDTIHLTVQLRNPDRPGQFDAYLIGQGPGGTVWFYDGRQLSRVGEHAWLAWSRKLPMPARATGRFALRSSTLAPGAYRWHVVLTDSGTYRRVAKGATAFTVEP